MVTETLINRKLEMLKKNGRVSCKSLEVARGVIDTAANNGMIVDAFKSGSYVGMGYWELKIRKHA
ncbi:hypothetical protein JOC94_004208 [Bacillus thermophilus]|uniref:Uncharacterized protein n=1 Tax=Siminovitchia thermophila TaxID=1245522 RepID=A0ABS2RBZ4_9BACI|nr:hypothetical protein [Siminovitchia thermophila]MBM7717183.1 hypothetical protein [Siminovitchia thermophila]